MHDGPGVISGDFGGSCGCEVVEDLDELSLRFHGEHDIVDQPALAVDRRAAARRDLT
jgi:hypothetical protein